MTYRVKDGFMIRKVGPQIMAVPIGQRTSEVHGLVALTESAELLWNILQKDATKEELVDALLAEYDVDRQTAEADVDKFLEGLKIQGVLADA